MSEIDLNEMRKKELEAAHVHTFSNECARQEQKKKGAAGDEEAGDGKGYFQDGRSDVVCLKHLGSIQWRGRN